MRGASLHWFRQLWEGIGVIDIGAAFRRSLALGTVVMMLTVGCRCWPARPTARSRPAARCCSIVVVASLIMPSIIVSLGVGLMFRLLDTGLKTLLEAHAPALLETFTTTMGLFSPAWARAVDLDAALRPPDHVRGVQPLQPGL